MRGYNYLTMSNGIHYKKPNPELGRRRLTSVYREQWNPSYGFFTAFGVMYTPRDFEKLFVKGHSFATMTRRGLGGGHLYTSGTLTLSCDEETAKDEVK